VCTAPSSHRGGHGLLLMYGHQELVAGAVSRKGSFREN
jgi:hypothetical protein